MNIDEIKQQYDLYCKRMREKGAEFDIIPFSIFKDAMQQLEEKKDV